MSERVFIIGAGRVGQGLARAFRLGGVDLVGLHGRRPLDMATSSGPVPHSASTANVILLAVRDDQIDEAVAELVAGRSPLVAQSAVVLHTSGTAEPASFADLAGRGIAVGTFHPLVPFLRPDRAPELLHGAWIGIDGTPAARAASRRLAGHVGARTLDIPAGQKAAYHAAAVFAANFPVALAAMGSDLLQSLGVAARSADGAVESLMRASVSNIDGGPPGDALTGPIARGDVAMVRQHLAALRRDERLLGVYRRLSLATLPVAARNGVDPERLREIEKALRGR
ncbi:MAG TPA: DUF2520 domain-containing protein [Gemmatimonadaceae bacterium]|nr:DUF2520 domain-containing protein [Gemmatimonadaceae bacterium]